MHICVCLFFVFNCKVVVGCWHGYVSGSRCRFAYGPVDATAAHFSCSSKSIFLYVILIVEWHFCSWDLLLGFVAYHVLHVSASSLIYVLVFVLLRADKRRTGVACRNTSEKDATFTRDTGVCTCVMCMCVHVCTCSMRVCTCTLYLN